MNVSGLDNLLIPPTEALPLESILANEELTLRPPRKPDYKSEAEGLGYLAKALGSTTESILQKLAEVALRLTGSDSAGVSIAEVDKNDEIFRWRGVAGQLSPFIMGTMPREFSPCGHVTRTETHHLMVKMIGHYPYVSQLGLPLHEVLLVPFFSGGKPVGTLWAVAHSPAKKFDREDLRLLNSLSRFASAAFQTLRTRDESERSRNELRTFFLQAPAPMAILHGPEHRYTLVNKLYEEFVGRKVFGKTVREVFREDEIGFFAKILDRVYETGEPYVGRELPMNLFSNEEGAGQRRINLSYTPFRNESGKVEGVMVFSQDVTEQYNAKIQIEKHNKHLSHLIDEMRETT